MQLSPAVIIDQALSILATYGLGDVSIRRIATSLSVAPAALYWHFPNKQALLAGVADELLRPLFSPDTGTSTQPNAAPLPADEDTTPASEWTATFTATAEHLYTVCIQCRDAAEVISAALPTGLVVHDPRKLFAHIIPGSSSEHSAKAMAETVTNFIIGQAMFEQARDNIAAVAAGSTAPSGSENSPRSGRLSPAVQAGIEILTAGIAQASVRSLRTPSSTQRHTT